MCNNGQNNDQILTKYSAHLSSLKCLIGKSAVSQCQKVLFLTL